MRLGATGEPEKLSIKARGMTFGALAWGDPDAPLALMAHGYPDTAWTWRHLGPFLAERGWRAVAPFTRGYAPTDLAPDDRYDVVELAKDLVALRTALGGDSGSVLIGHDWGATAVWVVTATEPDAFARYVALAVMPPAAFVAPWGSVRTLGVAVRQARMSWYLLYNQIPGTERTLGRLIPTQWEHWSPGYQAAGDIPQVFEALGHRSRRRAALRYYRNTFAPRMFNHVVRLKPRAPVLYLHGDRDGCIQAELGSLCADRLPPGSQLQRVPNVGHFLQLEDPSTVNALIGTWIAPPSTSHPGSAGSRCASSTPTSSPAGRATSSSGEPARRRSARPSRCSAPSCSARPRQGASRPTRNAWSARHRSPDRPRRAHSLHPMSSACGPSSARATRPSSRSSPTPVCGHRSCADSIGATSETPPSTSRRRRPAPRGPSGSSHRSARTSQPGARHPARPLTTPTRTGRQVSLLDRTCEPAGDDLRASTLVEGREDRLEDDGREMGGSWKRD